MDKLLIILEEINETADFTTATKLIDQGILDSMAILALVSEIENEFDVEISPIDLIPENFNSMAAMMALITKLKDEQ